MQWNYDFFFLHIWKKNLFAECLLCDKILTFFALCCSALNLELWKDISLSLPFAYQSIAVLSWWRCKQLLVQNVCMQSDCDFYFLHILTKTLLVFVCVCVCALLSVQNVLHACRFLFLTFLDKSLSFSAWYVGMGACMHARVHVLDWPNMNCMQLCGVNCMRSRGHDLNVYCLDPSQRVCVCVRHGN